jgi:predicted hydrolase (HD superfamily)
MSTRPVPLHDLAILVENAVQQVIEKHGGGPIEKLWFGFVAPEALATEAIAAEVVKAMGHQTGGQLTPAVATQGLAAPSVQGALHTEALVRPGHIIGLVYQPKLTK